MAEMKDAHIVEIPVDEEHQQKLLSEITNNITEAIEDHPLTEISESPGHLLLLKLWQREEDLFARRIVQREAVMDSIRREIFQLCSFYFIVHGFLLTLLFTSSVNPEVDACKKWWIPSLVSLSNSLVLVFLVQVKLHRYWRVFRQLQREKNDNRALSGCIQELRMKGASFDLSKEPESGKKKKSSSVEIKWKPFTWCSQNLLTLCLVSFTDLRPLLTQAFLARPLHHHFGPSRSLRDNGMEEPTEVCDFDDNGQNEGYGCSSTLQEDHQRLSYKPRQLVSKHSTHLSCAGLKCY